MGQNEKLIAKIKSIPSDLRYEELKKFFESLGYRELTKGKSSGSRVMFHRKSDNDKILCHKPHGGDAISKSFIKDVIKHFEDKGEL